MEIIRLATWIDAPVERCFQLSLSIDLHVASAQSTHEKAVAGVTSGLIREGETVTFQGRHLGLRRRHTSRMQVVRPFSHFQDVMIAGSFRHFVHDHHFAAMDDGTRIRDEIRFSLPWGLLGQMANRLYVRRHLIKFLTERNAFLKQVAESKDWRRYLENHQDRHNQQGTTTAAGLKNAEPGTWNKSGLIGSSR